MSAGANKVIYKLGCLAAAAVLSLSSCGRRETPAADAPSAPGYAASAGGEGSASDDVYAPEWVYVPETIHIEDEKAGSMQLFGDTVCYIQHTPQWGEVLAGDEIVEEQVFCRYSLAGEGMREVPLLFSGAGDRWSAGSLGFTEDDGLWARVQNMPIDYTEEFRTFLCRFNEEGGSASSRWRLRGMRNIWAPGVRRIPGEGW